MQLSSALSALTPSLHLLLPRDVSLHMWSSFRITAPGGQGFSSLFMGCPTPRAGLAAWQVLNKYFSKKCISEMIASWIPLVFGVLGFEFSVGDVLGARWALDKCPNLLPFLPACSWFCGSVSEIPNFGNGALNSPFLTSLLASL